MGSRDSDLRLSDLVIAAVCFALIVLFSFGCGSGGDSGDASPGGATTKDGNASVLQCNLGNGNTFVFNVGDNSSVNLCVLNGGTIENIPDNSSTDDHSDQHPNDQSGQTKTVNNPPPGA